MEAKKEYSAWRSVYFCKSCNAQLGYHTLMHSDGCCPHCGANSGDTIIDYNQKSSRRIYEVTPRGGLFGMLGLKKKSFIKTEIKNG